MIREALRGRRAAPGMSVELLARAASLFRCPGCGRAELAATGGGLACRCGRRIEDRGGFLDFLGDESGSTPGERLFENRLFARTYTRVRESWLCGPIVGRKYDDEVQLVSGWLDLRPDALVLDVPCGQGNFTAALAARCPRGLVVGVDLSVAQLRLAASRLARREVRNAILVRASALELPLGERAVGAVSSSGGLHLFADVPRAVAEMRRVLAPEGRVAGLTFLARGDPLGRGLSMAAESLRLLRTFDFDRLGAIFADHGFEDWGWERGRLLGWFRARAGH